MRVLIRGSNGQRMDVCPESEPEGSERDGRCDVESCRAGRVPKAKSFVADMSRVRYRADHPGCQTPHLYMVGRHGKHDANEGVYAADYYHRANPRLPIRFSHVRQLTVS